MAGPGAQDERVDLREVLDWIRRRHVPSESRTTLAPNLRSRIRGCLLGGAVGDALGRAVESMNPGTCPIEEYRKWHGWRGGPIGTITDDTQMTMWLAESLLEKHRLDPQDLAERFSRESIRGIGQATRQWLGNFKDVGLRWDQAGVASAGNGAAMRAAPVGLFFARCPSDLVEAAAIQAYVTHAECLAVASSIVLATAVARLLATEPEALADPGAAAKFSVDLAASVEGLADGREYRTRKTGTPSSLRQRLTQEVPRLLKDGASPKEANDVLWSGAYVLESLPMALFCFLRFPSDFGQVLLSSVNWSRDSDTVGSMACNLAGALNGTESIPEKYLKELEYRERLVEIADGIHNHLKPGAV